MNPYYMQTVNHWILQSVAMGITVFLIPRLRVTNILGPVLTVLGIALVNATIWDAALFFQIPNSWEMQALTLLLANGVIFLILVKLLPGIEVSGILPALAAPVVFTVLSVVIQTYGRTIDWSRLWNEALKHITALKLYITT